MEFLHLRYIKWQCLNCYHHQGEHKNSQCGKLTDETGVLQMTDRYDICGCDGTGGGGGLTGDNRRPCDECVIKLVARFGSSAASRRSIDCDDITVADPFLESGFISDNDATDRSVSSRRSLHLSKASCLSRVCIRLACDAAAVATRSI